MLTELCCIGDHLSIAYTLCIHPVLLNRARHAKAFRSFEQEMAHGFDAGARNRSGARVWKCKLGLEVGIPN